ncbi:unnamed protein product [Paramecium primaurelia]|uniref:Transmembrane protein n=1 Tax=Paramecium primaurelia TaxID=5886 RepID=A0A8S1R007_PARPR|nr:unnamed protein product [Paramecium primaurelia]
MKIIQLRFKNYWVNFLMTMEHEEQKLKEFNIYISGIYILFCLRNIDSRIKKLCHSFHLFTNVILDARVSYNCLGNTYERIMLQCEQRICFEMLYRSSVPILKFQRIYWIILFTQKSVRSIISICQGKIRVFYIPFIYQSSNDNPANFKNFQILQQPLLSKGTYLFPTAFLAIAYYSTKTTNTFQMICWLFVQIETTVDRTNAGKCFLMNRSTSAETQLLLANSLNYRILEDIKSKAVLIIYYLIFCLSLQSIILLQNSQRSQKSYYFCNILRSKLSNFDSISLFFHPLISKQTQYGIVLYKKAIIIIIQPVVTIQMQFLLYFWIYLIDI